MFNDAINDGHRKASGTEMPRSAFKNPLLYSSTVIVIAAVVVGWILFSRWQENRQIESKTVEERAQKQKQNDDVALEQFGGKELAIQMFTASPGIATRGQLVQLCYGVANAKTVKLEPQTNPVWPSYSRCVDVTPKIDTTYTLTIEDAAGHSQSQQLEVKVR
jgi:hypothetical protein